MEGRHTICKPCRPRCLTLVSLWNVHCGCKKEPFLCDCLFSFSERELDLLCLYVSQYFTFCRFECNGSSLLRVGSCHSRCGTLKFPHCSMVMSAEYTRHCTKLYWLRFGFQNTWCVCDIFFTLNQLWVITPWWHFRFNTFVLIFISFSILKRALLRGFITTYSCVKVVIERKL